MQRAIYVDLKINGLPVRFKYSTPSCYLKAIQGAKLATKFDDFFPYASDPHAFWTGYFTSRPAFKYLDRLANNVFQAAKQLVAMAGECTRFQPHEAEFSHTEADVFRALDGKASNI